MGDSPVPASTLAVERRRHPRVAPVDDIHLSIPIVMTTQVIDVSSGGALLSTSEPLGVGQRAHLRALLGGEPFSAWVEVRRVHPADLPGPDAANYLGVTFTAVDDASRRTLLSFVKDDERR